MDSIFQRDTRLTFFHLNFVFFSKCGSFFCDCGAKGCSALKSVSYPQPRRATTQKYAAFSCNRSKQNGSRGVITFHHFAFTNEEKTEVLQQLVSSNFPYQDNGSFDFHRNRNAHQLLLPVHQCALV